MKWYHSYETLELNTPSRLDGVDFENEARYRKEGARFIMDIGNKLGLPYLTMASGIVFFHRFYMFHSFKEFSRWVVGPTCLFLAGKVEETPKKCRDILKVTQQSLPDHRFKAFGDNPREEVMIIERILLQTIKFDLQLNHPYSYLIKFGKLLKGDMEKINGFVQKAWIFINDSLSTTLCLIYKPQVIGLAVLLLSFKISNQNIRDFMPKSRPDWWKTFYPEAKEADLEEICEELTNMYKGKPPKKRFPNVTIDKLKNSPKQPGSPQPKKSKMQQTATTESPLAAQSTTITTVSTTSSINVSVTPTTVTLVSVTTTPSTVTRPPPTVSENGKATLSISISKDINTTVEPMQLATPTAPKISFTIQKFVPTAASSGHTPKPPPPEPQTLPFPQPLPPPSTIASYPPPPQPQPVSPRMISPKVQRHEQLKSFLQNQQHSPRSHPNLPGFQQSQTTSIGIAPQIHSMQRSTPQPAMSQQSPFKPTAPILDHMSSFFQSTPPSKSQQQQPPPLPKQPQPPLPQQQPQPPLPKQQQPLQLTRPLQQAQQQILMPNSPGHIARHNTPMMDINQPPIAQMQLTQPQPLQGLPIPPSQPQHNQMTQQTHLPQVQPQNQAQYNAFQQAPYNPNTNPMQNFQPTPPFPPPQMPGFPPQPGGFMPMPPSMNQQQNYINNSGQNGQMNTGAFTFNPQQPMMMQNRLQQPQNNMSSQHPYSSGNYF